MAVLNFQTVDFVYADGNSRNAWVWLHSVGAWRQIQSDNFDCVTNMVALAAAARANSRLVDVGFTDSNQINYITLR